MRSPAPTLASLLATVLLVAARPAAAAAAATDPSTPGALRVKAPDGALVDMPLRHTKVSIEVTAFVARATIEQVFANPFQDPVEAVYTFPLGDRAAVDDFELVVGDRTIRGEIKRREEARATYEQARAAGYQAALLEQERPNIFTQSVANLEPGNAITVRLRTVETLRYERGLYRLTFPLVVGPRYIPGGSTVPDAARISPPVMKPGLRSGHDVEISVSIDAGVPLTAIESASHRVVVEKTGASGARVRLAPDDTIPNKDFLLRWSVSAERPAVALLAHRDGLDGFFTLLVQPKGEVGPTEAMPKEITFVVDTSGSMSGIPLDASKRLIARALHELGPRDTFNVVRFSGDNEVFSKDPLPNESTSIESAISWINRQQGGGGTEMLPAMRAAFARAPDPNRLRLVVFFTDGFVGNDPEILASIGRVLGQARIYTVGIGSSVNHYLLDRMADLGHGACVFVRPDESADEALDAFKSWVTRPYLTDLAVDWGALPVADLEPERLRDLGSGQTLTLVGRYLAAGEGDVTVRGKLGGRYWEQTIHVVLPERETRHEPLASLWARGRIEELLLGAPGGARDSVRAEVTSLALEYRLMSTFTSFVAVDDSRVVNPSGQSQTVTQSLPMPEGISYEGVFGKDGPAGLQAKGDAAQTEDHGDDAVFHGDPGGVGGGIAGGVPGGIVSGVPAQPTSMSGLVAYNAPPPPPPPPMASAHFDAKSKVEKVIVVGQRTTRDLDAAEATSLAAADFLSGPQSGRFYQNTLTLSPGTRDRDFKAFDDSELSSARASLLDAAFRVLADLADDGKISPSEGRPALAALLAAQRSTGAIAEDVAIHAVATWALAEAAAALPSDPWIAKARTKAADYLISVKAGGGWPARPEGTFDAEATRWARMVLGGARPEAVDATFAPSGEASPAFARLHQALAAGKGPGSHGRASGPTPFDRLVASIGRGHLKVVRA